MGYTDASLCVYIFILPTKSEEDIFLDILCHYGENRKFENQNIICNIFLN